MHALTLLLPALAILAIAVPSALEHLWAAPALRQRATAVGFVLMLGSVTPMTEFARALFQPRWQASSNTDLFEATSGQAMHYLARARGSAALDILAPVHLLPGVHEPTSGSAR